MVENIEDCEDASVEAMQKSKSLSAVRSMAQRLFLLTQKGNVPDEVHYISGQAADIDYLKQTKLGREALAEIEQAKNEEFEEAVVVVPMEENELKGDHDNDGIVDGAEVVYAEAAEEEFFDEVYDEEDLEALMREAEESDFEF